MKKLLQDAWRAVTGKSQKKRQLGLAGSAAESTPDGSLPSADVTFKEALDAQQAGRIPEAQAAYRSILERIPDYAPALHFLGVSHGQTGDLDEAERLVRRSIQVHALPEYFSNLALVFEQQGKRSDAIQAYRDTLALAPADVSTHGKLAGLLVAAGRDAEAEQVYRDALLLQPDDAELHFRRGAVLDRMARTTDALDAYRKALSLREVYPEAYNNLGNLLRKLNRPADAEQAYRNALLQQPDATAVHCNLGRLLQDANRHDEAEASYRRAMQLQPDFAGAYVNLGNLCAATGRIAEAEPAFREALALQPDHAEALSGLGLLLGAAGRLEEAEEAHRKVSSLLPRDPVAYNNLANLLVRMNRISDAEAAYRKAIELDSGYADACSNLGALLQERGSPADAEALLRRAVAIKPDSGLAHYNLGRLLLETRRYAEAEDAFNRTLQLQPGVAEAYDSLGTVLKESERYADAECAYRNALALQPASPGTLVNLGAVLQAVERYAEAEAVYREALSLDPGHDLARYNLALLCLAQKRLEEGWEGYEQRWNTKGFNVLRHQVPQRSWHGESLAGESVLVWQEQGVGDTVLYAGMIPDLLLRGARIVIECEARLVPLFARSFPQAQVVTSSNPPHAATRQARWQSPLGSLCRWLRTGMDDFKWNGPYLVPDGNQVSAFRKRYRELGQGPVVGISWRSGNPKVGRQKSMSLLDWTPMLAHAGATFVNLQYGDCEEELLQLKRETGITVYHDDTLDPLKDLDGFAAQVAAMDLVISTSNSTVHFAGALGIPVWTLLPRGGGALLWYWFYDGEQNPWYPSMRSFRQERYGDWRGLIARVANEFPVFLEKFR